MFKPNCVIVLLSPEIALKSPPVRSFLQSKLKNSIKIYLEKEGVLFSSFSFSAGRFFIQSDEPQKIISALKYCFGINSFALAEKRSISSLEEISLACEDVAEGNINGTFAIRGKSHSKLFSSKELEISLGAKILSCFPQLKVKLKGPDSELFCLAFEKSTFFYFNLIPAQGGMPVGAQGRVGLVGDSNKVLSLGFLLMRVGCSVLYSGNADISTLEKYNAFYKFRSVSKEFLEKNVLEGNLFGVFSDALTLSDAEKVSSEFGFKVFAPLLINQPKTPFD